ncbi:MAG: hypothetical protein LUI15_07315 [Firmicutes bacterium]|nr:hypothetical protein [Bacillota bacterium]MCD7944577.1 hypothetical protein [Clostridia bacterium]MCD8315070.1 hypothetical protein [Bacillota bacterium]
MAEKAVGKHLEYKGKPLVRGDNRIYYGNMSDDYVLLLVVMSTKEEYGRDVPDMIIVQILSTKENLKIVKQDVKQGFYDAFNTGVIWLERYLSGSGD